MKAEPLTPPKRFELARLWAYARRETVELLRDPIRLAFAAVGPIILMLAMGFGISFDIENLAMAPFDQDDAAVYLARDVADIWRLTGARLEALLAEARSGSSDGDQPEVGPAS